MRSIVLAFLVLASTAVAATPPLISKRSQTGFVMADFSRQETCEVYADRVVIVKSYGAGPGSFRQREQREISLSHGIRTAIARALAEPVEESENGFCDGPTTQTWIGSLESERVLFSTG